ncbi:hypothetical protein Tco_1235538 [Tanacetum coccineum]
MFQNLLKIGMLVWGEADLETSPKRSLQRKLFKTCCMNWGEVDPTHAYYNGSRTSKDNEDPSWSTSFKTRRTQKTYSALEDFICVVIVLDRNIKAMLRLDVKICAKDKNFSSIRTSTSRGKTSKDNEDPSWSTSFKTRRTQKTSLALEVL